MSNKNFNYAFVFYDINEKRVQKVFKVCKKYLSHYQKSVFRGEISPANLIKLRNEIKKIIVEEEDFVCILKMISTNQFEEEVIGAKVENGENLIL